MELKNNITELKKFNREVQQQTRDRVKTLNEPEDRTFEIIHTDTKKMEKM